MSRKAILAVLCTALASLIALSAAAAGAGGGQSGIRKPVLLVDVPQLAQCRGLLTQALLDRVINATEDPGETYEKVRRARRNMAETPPWVECESKLWSSLNRKTGLFNVIPQSSGPLGLHSSDPAAEEMVRSLAASVGSNVDPAGGVGDYQGEMQIAVNQNNPQQLVAAANTFYQDPSANCLSPTGGFSGTFGTQALYGSSDGGSTWTYKCAPWPPSLSGPVGASFFFGSDPAVAWDNQGRAYAAYMLLADVGGLSTAIVVARSTDSGQSWSPLGIVVNDLADSNFFDDKEMLAVDRSAGPPSAKSHPGRLYVIWDQNNIERVAHSDDGVSWTTVVLPPTGFGQYDVGADVKVGADGTAYVIWNRLIYPSGQTGEKIVFSKSVDGGNTWSAPVAVASTALLSFGSNNNPPAQDYRGVNAFGSLDVDRNPASPFFGTLYVAYCDFPSGTTFGTDLNSYVVRSTDGGATWSAPVKTNDDSGTASQFFPWLSVDQSDGTVNVSWYDTRFDLNNRKTQIFYARSSNGGVSFEPNLLVTDSGAVGWRNAVNYSDENHGNDNSNANANQYGDYGGCVAANRQVHPFWVDSRQFQPLADTFSPSRLEDAGSATIVNCSAPTGVTTPAASTTCSPSPRVQLSWSSVSGWGTNATNGTYAVYRSATAVFPGGAPLVSNLTGTTYADTTGLPGTTYYYFVTATNNCPGTILTPMTAVSAASAATVFPPCGATLGTLSGHVTVSGIPVAGATIGAGVYSATTDATGAYSIVIVTGTYTVSVTAAGYDPASQNNVVIANSATTTADFSLTPSTTAACLTDTTQADFQAATAILSVDLTSSPGSVKLATSAPSVYQTSGSLISSLKDSGAVVPGAGMTWTTVTWNATTPAGTSLKFQIAASNAASGPFVFAGPDGTAATFFTTSGASLAQFNGRRYLKYTAYLATTNTAMTPTLDSVTFCDQVSVCGSVTAPVITPSATQVCPFSLGNTATGPAGALAYSWSITNGTITAGATAQTVTFTAGPSGTTTLALVTSAASGCNAANSVGITIQTSTPSPSITPGGPTTFCQGSNVLLTSSSPSGNQWYLDGAVILGAVGPTYMATDPGSYSVTFTSGGCSSVPSAPVVVSLQDIPPAPSIAIGGVTTFCAGGSVTLTSTATSGNQWYLNGSPLAGATARTYSATASGDYTVTAAPAGSCTSAQSLPVTVTVKPIPPTPTITAGGPTTFCNGGSVTLTSSSATGNTWYLNGLSLGIFTQSISAGVTGNYTVTVSVNNCLSSSSAPVSVTVNPNPLQTPTVGASGPLAFCSGSSVTLTSSYTDGNQWYADGLPVNGATGQTLLVTTSGKYEVVVTQNGCSVISAGTSVTVSAQPGTPTITPDGPTTFCQGGSVVLTSSAGSISQWYLNGSPIPGGGFSSSLSVSTGGVYTVVANNNNCSSPASAPITVVVNPIPARPGVDVSGSLTFCQGGSVTLTSTTSSGNQWFKDGVAIGGATNQSFIATAAGSYTVVVTQGGCSSTASVAAPVIVNPIPAVPTITPQGSTTICENATVILQSSSTTGNQWFLNGNAISGAVLSTYTTSTAGNYTLQVTANGCVGGLSAPVAVTALPKPATPSITTTDALTFCSGGNALLKSNSAAGNQWYRDGQPIAGATNTSYAVTASGTYTVVATVNGCSSSTSDGLQVTVNPTPAQPIINPAGSVTQCSADPPLQLTSSNPTGNQWYFNGALIASATAQTITVTQAGTYTVGTTVAGCASSISGGTTVSFATSPAAPSVTAGGPTTFCSGGSVTLTSSAGSGNQWLRNGTPIANATDPGYIATTSGMYAVQVTGGSCKVSSLAMSVTVTATPLTPTIGANGPTTFCGPVSGTTLTSSNSSGNQWYLDGNPIAGATGSTYQPAGPGTFTVRTTVNGCTSTSAPLAITSSGLGGVTPMINDPTGTGGCASVPLVSNFAAGNQWYLNGVAINGATSQTYNATTVGAYTVKVSQGACSTLMSAPMNVDFVQTPPAKPVITSSGPATICSGGSVTLHATAADSWFLNGDYVGSGLTYVATQPGSYKVLVSGTPNCQSVYSDPIVVTAQTTPVVSITTAASIATGASGTASVATVSGATYLWTITNGTFIGAATGASVSFTAGSTGTLTLKATVTTSGGCAGVRTTNVIVTPTAGQEKFDPNGDAAVDPADVFYLVNYLFSNGPVPKGVAGPVVSGDANGDGVVDPADIFYLVNYLFTNGPHPFSRLTGTSAEPAAGGIPAATALTGRVSLGTPRLRDGHYVIPVLVSTRGGTAQAISVKVRIAGVAGGAAIHRAAALAALTASFETTRESGNVVSYVASFGPGARLDGVVAEIELDAPGAANLRLTLDPAVTMLTNAAGTLTASSGNGKLALYGTIISPALRRRATSSP